MGDLDALQWLYLYSNPALTGAIPATWGDPDAAHPLPALTRLYLYDTDWTGIYPDDIPQALLNKAGLTLWTNRRPTAPEIEATALTSGEQFTYPVVFSDRDYPDALTYHATLADGRALPATLPSNPEPGDLAFDPTTQSLSGLPPAAENDDIVVTVRVTDEDSPPDPPTEATPFCDPRREVSDSEANPPPAVRRRHRHRHARQHQPESAPDGTHHSGPIRHAGAGVLVYRAGIRRPRRTGCDLPRQASRRQSPADVVGVQYGEYGDPHLQWHTASRWEASRYG